jgi:phage tail-like protein
MAGGATKNTDLKSWDYPFVGFSFNVKFINTNIDTSPLFSDYEGNFQEISGLSVKISTKDVREGGENMFVHRIPELPKYENLVLKRGMFNYKDTKLIKWAQDNITKFSFMPKNLLIMLQDENRQPLATWMVAKAYPVGIKVSEFKSTENAVVVETIELSFDYFKRLT